MHLRPGQWDPRVMDQGRVWVDSAAVVHPVADLDDAHLVNITTMLRRDALKVLAEHATTSTGSLRALLPAVRTAETVVPLWEAAVDWLEHTLLWAALQVELDHRGLIGPQAFTRIDRTGGVWAIRTRDAVHVLDLDEHRTARVPNAPAIPHRRPVDWLRVRQVGLVQLGRTTVLHVSDAQRARSTMTIGPVTGIRLLRSGLSPQELVDAAVQAWPADGPVVWSLTEYRTEQFLAGAAVICDYWAGLTQILTNAGIAKPVLLVPRRLRMPHADHGAVDLCLTGPVPDHVADLLVEVSALVGFHLHLTTPEAYAGKDVRAHAVPFAPGP